MIGYDWEGYDNHDSLPQLFQETFSALPPIDPLFIHYNVSLSVSHLFLAFFFSCCLNFSSLIPRRETNGGDIPSHRASILVAPSPFHYSSISPKYIHQDAANFPRAHGIHPIHVIARYLQKSRAHRLARREDMSRSRKIKIGQVRNKTTASKTGNSSFGWGETQKGWGV